MLTTAGTASTAKEQGLACLFQRAQWVIAKKRRILWLSLCSPWFDYRSMPKRRNLWQFRPLHRVEHVLDDQAEFGIAFDGQFAVEEQRVRVFLTCYKLQKSRELGAEGQIGFAARKLL